MSIEAPIGGSIGSGIGNISSSSSVESGSIGSPVSSVAPSIETSATAEVFSMPNAPDPISPVTEGPVSPYAFKSSTWEAVVTAPNIPTENMQPLDRPVVPKDILNQPVLEIPKPAIHDNQIAFNPSEWQTVVQGEPSVNTELSETRDTPTETPSLVVASYVQEDGVSDETVAVSASITESPVTDTQQTIEIPSVVAESDKVQEEALQTEAQAIAAVREALVAFEENPQNSEVVAAIQEDAPIGEIDETATAKADPPVAAIARDLNEIINVEPADQQLYEVFEEILEDSVPLLTQDGEIEAIPAEQAVDVLVKTNEAQEVRELVQTAGLDEQKATDVVSDVIASAVQTEGIAAYIQKPQEALTILRQKVAVVTKQKETNALVTQIGETVTLQNAPEKLSIDTQTKIVAEVAQTPVEQVHDVSQAAIADVVLQDAPTQEVARQLLGTEEKVMTVEQEQDSQRSFVFVEDIPTQKVRGTFIKAAKALVKNAKESSLGMLGHRIVNSVRITNAFVSDIVRGRKTVGPPESIDGSLNHVVDEISQIRTAKEVEKIPTILRENIPVAIDQVPSPALSAKTEEVEKVIFDTALIRLAQAA